MTYHRLILATAAALGLGATGAAADCAEELAQLTGVAKEGAMAPLEGTAEETPQVGGDAATGETSAEQGRAAVAGEGATEALTDPGLATSEQDVTAQQEGGATAAEQAAGASAGTDRDAAIARAQTALDAGDEAGCMAAVEEAKGM
jgi:hypothetical protein